MSDTDVIERLVTQFDADVSKLSDKLDGVNRKVHGAVDSWEKRFATLDFGKALNLSAISASTGVLGEATASVGALGAGLSALGPAGLVAAGAIVAVGAALDQTKKAMAWADELEATAQKLGLTVEQVQAYDFVAKESGVSTDAMRSSLENLNVALGKVQDNLARGKTSLQAKAFAALELSPADLKNFQDAADLLPVIADRITKVRTAAEQAAIAKNLGLTELLPLLKQGGEAIRGMTTDAERLGGVMDAQMVRRLAEANHQVAALSQVIDTQMKEAFADLAPAIVTVVKLLADAARGLGDFFAEFQKLEDRSTSALRDQLKDLQGQQTHYMQAAGGPLAVMGPRDKAASPIAYDSYQEFQQQQKRIEDILALRDVADATTNPTGNIPDLKAAGGKHKNTGLALAKDVSDKLDEANKALADAMGQLTSDVMARADLEQKAVAAELDKQNTDLNTEADTVKADTTLSAEKKKQLLAEIEVTRGLDQQVADAKDEKITRDAEDALNDQAIELKEEINGYLGQAAAIEASLATTQAERNRIATANLLGDQLLEQKRLTEQYQNKVRADFAGGDSDKLDQDARDFQELMKDLKSLQAAQRDQLAHQQQGPLGDYIDQLRQATDPSTAAANVGVTALKGLNDSMLTLLTNTKDFGTTFVGALKNIGTQLLQLGIEKYLTLPLAQALNLVPNGAPGASGSSGGGFNFLSLLNFIPGLHFASGTQSAYGGLAEVGEHGPEIMNVPRGSQIIPNGQLGGGVPQGVSIRSTSNYFDLRGGIMTDDLVRQMNANAHAQAQNAAQQWAMATAQGLRKLIPAEIAARQGRQLS